MGNRSSNLAKYAKPVGGAIAVVVVIIVVAEIAKKGVKGLAGLTPGAAQAALNQSNLDTIAQFNLAHDVSQLNAGATGSASDTLNIASQLQVTIAGLQSSLAEADARYLAKATELKNYDAKIAAALSESNRLAGPVTEASGKVGYWTTEQQAAQQAYNNMWAIYQDDWAGKLIGAHNPTSTNKYGSNVQANDMLAADNRLSTANSNLAWWRAELSTRENAHTSANATLAALQSNRAAYIIAVDEAQKAIEPIRQQIAQLQAQLAALK